MSSYDPAKNINTDSSHLKNLGYTGHSNAEFDTFYAGLSDVEKEYVLTANPALLTWINAYKNTDDPYVRAQLEAAYNNYKSNVYSPNLLQQIGEGFGDYSGRVNFSNTANSNLNDAVSRILESKHTEDYTDPVNELARRKAAGLNDDLSGGSAIGSGEPGSIDEKQLPSGVVNDGSSVVSTIAQAGVNLFQVAFSIYSGLQSMRSAFLDNEAKELLMSNQLQDSAWSILGDSVAGYLQSNPKYSELDYKDPSFVEIMPSVIQSFGDRVNRLPYTNRQKRKLRNTIDNLAYTFDDRGNKVASAKFETLWNTVLSNRNKSRNDLATSSGLVGADKDTTEALKFLGENVYKPINQLQVELAKQETKFNSSYYRQANAQGVPALQADSEAVQLQFAKDMNNMKLKVTSAFEEINKKITGNRKISENWKMALQVGTSVAESLILTNMNNMPHLNIGLRNGVHDTRTTTVQMR